MTGLAEFTGDHGTKRLEPLEEAVPRAWVAFTSASLGAAPVDRSAADAALPADEVIR